jgi:hypothetical protein
VQDSAASLAERELFSRHDVGLIYCSHASQLSSQCCSWCCVCLRLLSQVDSTYQLLFTTSDWLAGCGLSIGSVLEDGVDDAAVHWRLLAAVRKPSDVARLPRESGFFLVFLGCSAADALDQLGLLAPHAVEVVGIDLYELLPLRRHGAFFEYGIEGAGRLTGAAIYAFLRVDVILLVFFGGMDTVHRADIHTGRVLFTDAGLGNDIGQCGVTILSCPGMLPMCSGYCPPSPMLGVGKMPAECLAGSSNSSAVS